ncbi:MAG: Ig-like domain-containing protein, partial [Planctomycetia bacterium]
DNSSASGLTADLAGNDRVIYQKVDIGAYEYDGDILVSTLADGTNGDYTYGDLTLREALYLADQNSGTDTIVFDPALFSSPGTMVLNGTPLAAYSDTIVEGPGENLLTIDADDLSRVFTVGSGKVVTLSDMTFTGGSSYDGAGVCGMSGSDVTLNDMTITGNTATRGGGVFVSNSELTLNNTTITNNTATYGGGIISGTNAVLTVNDSDISSNTGTNYGGGIAFTGGATGTVSGTTFDGNSSGYGGGIYVKDQSEVTFTDSTFSDNTATTYGGGARIYQATATFTNTDFIENDSPSGGGIRSDLSDLTILDGSTFVNNTATNGGGVYILHGSVDVYGTTMFGNVAIDGGALGFHGDVDAVVANSALYGNTASSEGGAIYTYGTGSEAFVDLYVINSTITANEADYGGGIDASVYDDVTIQNSIVSLNTATSMGNNLSNWNNIQPESTNRLLGNDPSFVKNPLPGSDGIWGTADDQVDLRLRYDSIAIDEGNNDIAYSYGLTTDIAGNDRILFDKVDIGAYEFSPITVSTLTDELDTDYSPGDLSLREALYLASQNPGLDSIAFEASLFASGPGTITGSEFAVNSDVAIFGPGAELLTISGSSESIFVVSDCITAAFVGMTVTGGLTQGAGGGFYVQCDSNITIDSCVITDNYSEYEGGGIFLEYDSTATINNSTISNNSTLCSEGGGIFVDFGSNLILNDSTISGNTAGNYASGGGIMLIEGGICTITNTIVSGNTANWGAGIYSGEYSELEITDSVFTNNTAEGAGGGLVAFLTLANIVNTEFSENTAEQGAGIYADCGAELYVSGGSVFSQNDAEDEGGAIFVYESEADIDRTTFFNNTATDGGGLYTAYGSNVTVTNSSFMGNVASYGGGAIHTDGSSSRSVTLDIVNSTIAGNDGYISGGIVIDPDDTATLYNSIVALNNAPFSPDPDISGTIETASSNNMIEVADPDFVEDPSPGTDGIWGTSDDEGDLHLSTNSMAIDDGLNSAVTSYGLTADLEGNARIIYDYVDIGAYEYKVAPTVELSHSETVNKYDIFNISALITDPGYGGEFNNTFYYSIDWGDGYKYVGIQINNGDIDESSLYQEVAETFTYSSDPINQAHFYENHTYHEGGTKTITVTVWDEETTQDTGTTIVTEVNVQEIFTASIAMGARYACVMEDGDFSYSDGAEDTFYEGEVHDLEVEAAAGATIDSITIDWGDGQTQIFFAPESGNDWGEGIVQTAPNKWTISHVYEDDGHYMVQGWFNKDDGDNEIFLPLYVVSGDVNLDGKVDGSDVTILADNWQAGVSGSGENVTWAMGDVNQDGKIDGSDVTIIADNWQAGVNTDIPDEDLLPIENVAPTLEISSPASAVVGAEYVLSLRAIDPGDDAVSQWVINWGDGSALAYASGDATFVTHPYTTANNYTIQIQATDEDGTYNTSHTAVIVDGLPTWEIEDVTLAMNTPASTIDLASALQDPYSYLTGTITYTAPGNTNTTLVSGTSVSNGILTLTYGSSQSGSSLITVRATDSIGTYVEQTFRVTLVNTATETWALSDHYLVQHDQTLDVNETWQGVLANDYDASGATLGAVKVQNPSHGYVNFDADGTFTYTPSSNFVGRDSFYYQTTILGTPSSEWVKVTIDVVNAAPVGAADLLTVATESSVTFGPADLTANDFDSESDDLLVVIVGNPSHGTLTENIADGTWTYAPNTGFKGADSFTYKVSDGYEISDPITVSIQVSNTSPIAVDDYYNVDWEATITVPVESGVLANDSDYENDSLSATLLTPPTNGNVTLSPDGSFYYTPNSSTVEGDSFTYTLTDSYGNTSTATVNLQIVSPSFQGVEDTYYVVHGQTFEIYTFLEGVLANDGVTYGSVTCDLVQGSGPSHFDGPSPFALDPNDGTFSYQSASDYAGQDSFQCTISNGYTTSDPITVIIEVTDYAPYACNDYFYAHGTTAVTFSANDLLLNDFDPDDDNSNLSVNVDTVAQDEYTTLIDNGDGTWTYDPLLSGPLETVVFEYTVSDGIETSESATITIITTPNYVPWANDSTYTL